MSAIKIVAIIEICLAIILLAGAVIGAIIMVNYNMQVVTQLQTIGGATNIDYSLFNTNITIIICSAILLGAIALLMLFDGVNKLI